jgi:26S proteasome regulatory subunit N8
LPDLSAEGVKRSFASSRNDQLLVVYLSSWLRAVIALHAFVDNEATIGRAELEEGVGCDENDREKDKDKKGKNAEKKDGKDEKDWCKSDSKGL